ncbi:hypothetical protein ACIPLC_27885 [Kitasatospora sp. NPDC086801]|uniref:hypothetical protein n=1 Tax=Kitasatospora sp. NPDC086801 TaxID=3364066 RepID=UPI0037F11D4C
MTAHLSSPGPAGPAEAHPSVDELADLAEGLIESADDARTLHRHLAGCAECRETADALGEVQALLGAVETPPMPADVAARLDAALAAASPAATAEAENGPLAASRSAAQAPAARAATAPVAPPSRPAAPTGPGRPRPRRRRVGLLLGAAAALAAIGLGGALLLHPAGQGDQHPTLSAGAPASASLGTGTGTGPGAAQSSRADHAAGAGPVYQDDQLATQVQQLLARAGSPPGLRPTGPAKPSAALPAEGRQELTTQASPPSCPAPAEGVPLATDHGSYAGAPVEVLVYPAPGRPGFADVYLRSPDCGPVVLERTVPTR